jgi:hypothetical protein
MKKVTLLLPKDLAENAAKSLGKASLAEAVRDVLREAVETDQRRHAYQRIEALRGKIEFGISADALKTLRD